jgi:hypothetical protein
MAMITDKTYSASDYIQLPLPKRKLGNSSNTLFLERVQQERHMEYTLPSGTAPAVRKLYKEVNFQEVIFLYAHCAAPVFQENWHT